MRIFLSTIFLLSMFSLQGREKPEFAVVIPSYNNERFCTQNLESVFNQTYTRWKLYYIHDAHKDNTEEKVHKLIRSWGMQDKCIEISNAKRQGALQNIYETIHKISPDTIVITIDGDDRLAHKNVFEQIASIYMNNKKVWMTHGSYITEPPGHLVRSAPIPAPILKRRAFRSYRFVTSHLRTFYARLFQLIKLEDLQYKDEFFPMAGDLAFMFPMLEMAAKGHIYFVKDTLYIYNASNPLNDFRVDQKFQLKLNKYIRALKPYAPLERLF